MFHPNGAQRGRGSRYALRQSSARAVTVGVLLNVALLGGIASGYTQALREPETREFKWEVFSGCRLVTNQVVDGDSFHVRHKEREYIFRLYFVDAPESDPALKERVKEQATFFGISTNDIPRAGEMASRFTREKLTGREITVITRWQNAMGRSRLARHYAVVMVNGTNLAAELVVSGLARIHGPRANWPDGPSSAVFVSQLKNLELAAREQKRGVWNQSVFPLEVDAPGLVTTNQTVSAPMDMNTASFEELQKLPGIGPKLAERIIAHRPYKNLEEFDKVPGIGPVTLKRLQPMIRVSKPAP